MRSLILSMAKEMVSKRFPELNVRVLYSESEKEKIPHCHVYRGDQKLYSVSLIDFEFLVGNQSVSGSEKKELNRYFTENRVYLRYAWDKCTQQTFFRPQYTRLPQPEIDRFKLRLAESTKNNPSIFENR